MKKVWVLTYEHNDYDQHGEYFAAVFNTKPTHEELAKVLSDTGNFGGGNIMSAIAYLEHLLKGGGRQKWEDMWYNLGEVVCKKLTKGIDFIPFTTYIK